MVDLRAMTYATPADGGDEKPVLDWRFIGLMA
jgi:hypothetical protein